ncbi:hypothetical protein J1G33_11825 [Pseudomonas sp. P867]|uniref:hypothetical protein n=1 Tax=unclassified Pseudomonas TaxID=196821 RepID=UPI001CA76805|nr:MULTISPECIES: hypothetical protein [unclassified Pseudomonas]MBY8971086.1 hypothetical protein [Pseudomonas sp. P867]MCK3850751.1 hypothetical protein [Pseudomonas sp. W2Jun17]
MSTISQVPTLPFSVPYFPTRAGGRPDHDVYRPNYPSAAPHYHACTHEHRADVSDYRPDRYFPEMHRARDYYPDRRISDMQPDWDYRPSRDLPQMRRDWDYLPERRVPDMRRDWNYPTDRYADQRPSYLVSPRLADEFAPINQHWNPAVKALDKLIDTLPQAMIRMDMDITTKDLLGGKYGPLSPSITKELGKLDEHRDYRMVTQFNGYAFTYLWAPVDGGRPVFIEQPENGYMTPTSGTDLLKLLNSNSEAQQFKDYGVTAKDLKNGKYGKLSPEIQKSLSNLEHDKNYSLIELFKIDNENTTLAWRDKSTGKIEEIGQYNIVYG